MRPEGEGSGTGASQTLHLLQRRASPNNGYHLYRLQERLKNAVELGDTSLMFLVHPTITPEEMDFCCRHIEGVMKEAAA